MINIFGIRDITLVVSEYLSGTDNNRLREASKQCNTALRWQRVVPDKEYNPTMLPDGSLLCNWQGDKSMRPSDSLAFTADGNQIFASSSQVIRAWNLTSKELSFFMWLGPSMVSAYFTDIRSNGTIWKCAIKADNTIRIFVESDERALLRGHEGPVNYLAFYRYKDKIISGSDDKTVKVWDAASGACLHTLRGHEDSVAFVKCSKDDRHIISGSDSRRPNGDRIVKIWDGQGGGECLDTIMLEHPVRTVALGSLNGREIAASSLSSYQGESIDIEYVKDFTSKSVLHTLKGHTGWINSIARSPDGSQIGSGSDDSTVRVWDVASGKCLFTLEGGGGIVGPVVFHPSGNKIAAACEDKTVKIWALYSPWLVRLGHALTGQCLRTALPADPVLDAPESERLDFFLKVAKHRIERDTQLLEGLGSLDVYRKDLQEQINELDFQGKYPKVHRQLQQLSLCEQSPAAVD
jgi:WD40 repeat protein